MERKRKKAHDIGDAQRFADKKSKSEVQLNSSYTDAAFQAGLGHAWRYVAAATHSYVMVTILSLLFLATSSLLRTVSLPFSLYTCLFLLCGYFKP